MEEVLVYQMTQLIDAMGYPDAAKKAQLSMDLIASLFIYLDKEMGITHEEMYQHFDKYRHFENS